MFVLAFVFKLLFIGTLLPDVSVNTDVLGPANMLELRRLPPPVKLPKRKLVVSNESGGSLVFALLPLLGSDELEELDKAPRRDDSRGDGCGDCSGDDVDVDLPVLKFLLPELRFELPLELPLPRCDDMRPCALPDKDEDFGVLGASRGSCNSGGAGV
jgi:hypothetical protein